MKKLVETVVCDFVGKDGLRGTPSDPCGQRAIHVCSVCGKDICHLHVDTVSTLETDDDEFLFGIPRGEEAVCNNCWNEDEDVLKWAEARLEKRMALDTDLSTSWKELRDKKAKARKQETR